MTPPITINVDESLVQAIAERVAAILLERQAAEQPAAPTWLHGAKALAEYLGWPVGRVQKLTAARQLPSHRVGQRYSYRRAEIDEWLAKG